MAQTLLAVLLVLAATHALPDLARLRDFSWLKAALTQWTGAGWAPWLLALLIFLACVIVQGVLAPVLFGLPAFAFAIAVLFYSWGPRELDADIEAVLKAPDSERRLAAAQALRPDPVVAELPLRCAPLVEATFLSALSRRFGVLFWFVVLGPAGALGYRVVQLLAKHAAFTRETSAAQHDAVERTSLVLDWAPAHLMALTLALVSEFDAVIKTWREYHASRGYFSLDLGFLGALARAGVEADVIADDVHATDAGDPLVALADARTVLRRILMAWLALIALLVLAGWAG